MAVKKTQIREDGPIPRALLEILACPVCKSGLKYSTGHKSLICAKCKKNYLINGKIPSLFP